MGMYDSIVIEHNNKAFHLQTKRFYGTFKTYRVGDVIDGVHTGVHCYFQPFYLNQKGEADWNEIHWTERYQVFVTIAEGIYCDFQVRTWMEDDAEIQSFIKSQQNHWKDKQRVLDIAIKSLKRYQHSVSFYHEKNKQIIRLLEYAENGEQWDNLGLGMHLDENIRHSIYDGKLCDEILAEIKQEPEYRSYENAIDELDSYRL